MVDQLSGFAQYLVEDPDAFALATTGRMGVVMNLEAGLTAVLDSMIAVMERR